MRNDRADIGIAVLRVVAGGLIAFHGLSKITNGIEGFQGMVDGLGLPLPGAFAWAVALFELFGGLAIVAGVATKWVSGLFVALFVGTTVYVKFGQMGAGLISGDATAEADLLYLGAFATLALLGAGAYSLDGRRSQTTQQQVAAAV